MLLGLQWLAEGGGLLVRAGEGIDEVGDLRGRRIGLSRSLNPRKVDYRRVTDERGVEVVLAPARRGPRRGPPCRLRPRRRLVRQAARRGCRWPGSRSSGAATGSTRTCVTGRSCRSSRPALIDACFVTDPFDLGYPDYPGFALIGSLARHPDWTLQVGGAPYALTCTRAFADEHPDLVTAYLTGLVRAGRRCNDDPWATARLLETTGFFLPAETTHEKIRSVDFVPNLSDENLAALEIEKDFMLGHGYIAHDIDVSAWAAPEFLAAAHRELDERAGALVRQRGPCACGAPHASTPTGRGPRAAPVPFPPRAPRGARVRRTSLGEVPGR